MVHQAAVRGFLKETASLQAGLGSRINKFACVPDDYNIGYGFLPGNRILKFKMKNIDLKEVNYERLNEHDEENGPGFVDRLRGCPLFLQRGN